MRRAGWHLAIGVAGAVLLLGLALRGVDLPRLWQALATANYWYLLPAAGLTLASFYLRAVRWGVLLSTVKPISHASLFSATMIGFAANNLLPARIGEFVRAWAIGRQERISRSSAFATVVVERVVDVFSLLFFFALMLLVHPFPESVRRAGWLMLGLNVALLGILLWAERHPARVGGFSRWLAARAPARTAPRVRSLLDNFVAGLGILRQATAIGRIVVQSLLVFAFAMLSIHACLMAFGFAVPWYASLVLLVATTLGFIVAPTPGYVGAVQVACVWALSLFGVERSHAFSFSLFFHASQFFPVTLVGLWCLARHGLSLSQVAGAAGEGVKEPA